MVYTYLQRSILFWGVCLPLRYYLRTHYSDRKELRVVYGLTGLKWLFFDDVTQTEGFFGGPLWWKDVRKVHAPLLLAYSATGSQLPLSIDLVVAVVAWFAKSE